MKMKALATTLVVGLIVTAAVAGEQAEEKISLEGAKCPVSGKAALKCPVAYQGGKVFFCCPKCAAAFKKDPAKYAAKANLQLYVTKQAKLVRCPFTCKKLNSETAIEVGGAKVCFCCAKCKSKALSAQDTLQCVFNDKQFANGFEVVNKGGKKKQ